MKKTLVAIAAVACAVTTLAVAAKAKKGGNTTGGKVLNIACWNEEFQERFNAFYASKLPSDVKVNWIMTPNQGGAYRTKLDELLLGENDDTPADERLDLFLVESDYALNYVNTPYTLDVKKEIGLTDADLAQQYKYTKDVMTGTEGKFKGKLKGVSWQACPGGFIYRRSFAKQVLGTDDPVKVQQQLNSWEKFDAVAAKMKANGYFMLSGFDDAFRVFSDNVTEPLVKNGKINIDPQIRRWIKQTKEYTDKGYNNKANLWTPESGQGASKNGKVFGYFGPAWFIDFCLTGYAADDASKPFVDGNGSCGDWAFCEGPQGFSWGGTWICGSSGSDNVDLIKDIMYTMTCDKAVAKKIVEKYNDFTNNEPAMTEIANGSYKSAFLGGQNHIALMLQNAKKVDKSKISGYDQDYAEKIQAAMADYYNGKISEDQAWANFKMAMIEAHPELKKKNK